jgi:hypothetical protein
LPNIQLKDEQESLNYGPKWGICGEKKSFLIKQTVKDVGYNTNWRDILLNFLIGNPKIRMQ